jgi:DNA-directed RNA polymerase subunit M/transcription elongation factor TFIIS
MSEIHFACPQCQERLIATPPEKPGDNLQCPACKNWLTVPAESSPISPALALLGVAPRQAQPASDQGSHRQGMRSPAVAPRTKKKKLALLQKDPEPAHGTVSIFKCPECNAMMPAGMFVCEECGYNKQTGRKLGTGKKATKGKESPELRKQLRNWGLGLVLMGGASIYLKEHLHPMWIWGAVLIGVGAFTFILQQRIMFMVIGTILIFVGAMNIMSTMDAGFTPWMAVGAIQMFFGVREMRNYMKQSK